MSVVTDLQEARELILKEENWTKEAFARDARGNACNIRAEGACQWCATGALEKVTLPDLNGVGYMSKSYWTRYDEALDALLLVVRPLGGLGVASYNDEHGHSATIEMFDAAIKLAKGQA